MVERWVVWIGLICGFGEGKIILLCVYWNICMLIRRILIYVVWVLVVCEKYIIFVLMLWSKLLCEII